MTPDVRNLLRHLRVPGLAYRDFRAAAPAPVRRTEQRQGLVTIGLVSLVPSVGRTALCANLTRAFAQAGARAGAVDVPSRPAWVPTVCVFAIVPISLGGVDDLRIIRVG